MQLCYWTHFKLYYFKTVLWFVTQKSNKRKEHTKKHWRGQLRNPFQILTSVVATTREAGRQKSPVSTVAIAHPKHRRKKPLNNRIASTEFLLYLFQFFKLLLTSYCSGVTLHSWHIVKFEKSWLPTRSFCFCLSRKLPNKVTQFIFCILRKIC